MIIVVVELEVEQELATASSSFGGFGPMTSVGLFVSRCGAARSLADCRLGGGLIAALARRVVVGERDDVLRSRARARRRRIPSRILLRHRRLGSASTTAVSPALGLEAGLAGIRAAGGWPSLATRSVTAPTVSSSPCFQDLLACNSFAVDERPVGAAQVTERELASDLEELAMAPADLRRLDADHTVVVATEAGHVVGQLECRRGASAPHDLEYIIHRRLARSVGTCACACLPTK